MSTYVECKKELQKAPRCWLVTGAAGFIGSHLVQALLDLDQKVCGLDNLSTGYRHNLETIRTRVSPARWSRFTFLEGGVEDAALAKRACEGCEFVVHQAALGSVPRSVNDPITSHRSNVEGFITILDAARLAKVQAFVYASSSSVYGDHPALPKREDQLGALLSPYAATKRINEIYAQTWSRTYGLPTVGLRYFNVFGERQDPQGAYAAVIPRWIDTARKGEACVIHGDGKTSRDFCAVANVVQANILAAMGAERCSGQLFNIACGAQTDLLTLHNRIWEHLVAIGKANRAVPAQFSEFRAGDIRHSLADISRAQEMLGYTPDVSFEDGIRDLVHSTAKG